MDRKITYGQLYQHLQELDFTRRKVCVDGKDQYLFEHPSSEAAVVFLPVRESEEQVEPFFLHSVLVLLKAHHLVSDPDLLDLLANGHRPTAAKQPK